MRVKKLRTLYRFKLAFCSSCTKISSKMENFKGLLIGSILNLMESYNFELSNE
jgi:hypothetical protein